MRRYQEILRSFRGRLFPPRWSPDGAGATGEKLPAGTPPVVHWPADRWRVSPPETQDMSCERLLDLERHLEERMLQIKSVLVIRHGHIVFEKYRPEYGPDYAQEVFSVTKSILSALIGIALKEGHLSSLDQKIVEIFPEFITSRVDPRLYEVTLKHMLTMTSGIQGEPSILLQMMNHPDWIAFALNSPLSHRPGNRFEISTPASHLLSGVVTRVTKMSVLAFGDRWFFGPLGIETPSWEVDPHGFQIGGFGLTLKPRDMAKIGYLYLNRGCWGDREIVPSAWVKESTRVHIATDDPVGENYGYLWWISNAGGFQSFYAAGFGGQFIYVIPALDIVVVITSEVISLGLENKEIIELFIVPAATT